MAQPNVYLWFCLYLFIFFLISSWLGQDFYIITRPKSYFPYLPYLPLWTYFPGRNIPANSTGKYWGWNLPLNLEYCLSKDCLEVCLIIYKYYIPERVIVSMFTLRKWLSTETKPRLIIIFEGWTFLLLPSQECTSYFIIPKLLSGKKRYVNGADEEDAAFRRNKKLRQNCSNLVSKCAARSN